MSSLTHILRHGIIAASANKEESDPFWEFVVLLLKGNGDTIQTPSAATFKDYSKYGRVSTSRANVCLVPQGRFHEGIGMSDPSLKKDTTLNFTGSGLFNLNTDYTFEFFVKVTEPSVGYFMGFTAGVYFVATANQDRPSIAATNFGVSGSNELTPIDTFNKWYHVAACKQGSVGYIFVDGVLVLSGASSSTTPTALNLFGVAGRTDLPSVTHTQIDELRFTNGICRYLSNFVPPTREFPTKGAVIGYNPKLDIDLLCHFEKGTSSSVFFDETGKNVNRSGASVGYVDTAKFGQNSLQVLSNGSYLRTYQSGWFSNHSAFTIECWVYCTQSNQNAGIWYLANSTNAGTTGLAALIVNDTRNIQMTYKSVVMGTGSIPLPINTWSHIAVSLLDDYLYVAVDGVVEKFPTAVTGIIDGTNKLLNIGALYAGQTRMVGYIDELRLTSRFALYTQDFTPPNQPFTY